MEGTAPVHVERIPYLMQNYKNRITFQPKGPFFQISYQQTGLLETEADNMMQETERFLLNLQMLYTE